MLETTKAIVAGCTKETSDRSGVVAMIDREYIVRATGRIRKADGAATFLLSQHSIVFSRDQSVGMATSVFRIAFGIVCSPLALLRVGIGLVFDAPSRMIGVGASLATTRQAVVGSGRSVKLVEREVLLAESAPFQTFRRRLAGRAHQLTFGACARTHLAVGVETVRFRAIFGKLGLGFLGRARLAEFHGSLPGCGNCTAMGIIPQGG